MVQPQIKALEEVRVLDTEPPQSCLQSFERLQLPLLLRRTHSKLTTNLQEQTQGFRAWVFRGSG